MLRRLPNLRTLLVAGPSRCPWKECSHSTLDFKTRKKRLIFRFCIFGRNVHITHCFGIQPDGGKSGTAVAVVKYARQEVTLALPQGVGSSVNSDMAGRMWTTAKHFVLTIPVAFTFNDIGTALACTHMMHIKMRICLLAYS